MSEQWRHKKYYDKRVLLSTARVLDPQFSDILICLTGSELELLRNLTLYLHRRSTFASAYLEEYYLAPSSEEWDELQQIVAELESKLMGCDELTAAVTNIAAQLQCICLALQTGLVTSQPQDTGYDGQPYYDDYISPVVENEGTPPGDLATWDAWRATKCIGAQKLVTDVTYAVLKMGEQLTGGILLTFSVVNALLLLTVISIPVSVVVQIITTIVAIGVSFAYEDIAQWLVDHKQGLVCAIYNAPTASFAYSAVSEYITSGWDAGSGMEVVRSLFPLSAISDIFDYTQRDYDAWSGDYSELYCDDCEDLPLGTEFVWTWPPCPGTHHLDGGICSGGRLSFNGDIAHAHQQHLVDLVTYNRVTIECRFRSCFGSGWTVGDAGTEWYDVGLEEWVTKAYISTHTDVAIGELNTVIDTYTLGTPVPGGLSRTRLKGATGQHETDPYPLQVEYLRILYESI